MRPDISEVLPTPQFALLVDGHDPMLAGGTDAAPSGHAARRDPSWSACLPAVVAGAGALLMPSSPRRPAQSVVAISPGDAGWRVRSARAAMTRKAWASMASVAQRYQERQRRT